MNNELGLAQNTNPIEARETSPYFYPLIESLEHVYQGILGNLVSKADIEKLKQEIIYLYRPEGEVVRRMFEIIKKKRLEAYFPKLPKNMKLGVLPEDVRGMKEVYRINYKGGIIYSINVIEDGGVVILKGEGVIILNKTDSGKWSDKKVIEFDHDFQDLQILDDGSLAVAGTKGLCIYTKDGKKKGITNKAMQKLQVLDGLNIVSSISQGPGLKLFTNTEGKTTERMLISDKKIDDFQVLPEGGVLAYTFEGIKIYPMDGSESKVEEVKQGFIDSYIIIQAHPDGSFWFSGEIGTGILKKNNGKWEEEIIDDKGYSAIQYLVDGRVVSGGREGIVVFKKTPSGWKKDVVFRCNEGEIVGGIQVTPDEKIMAYVNRVDFSSTVIFIE